MGLRFLGSGARYEDAVPRSEEPRLPNPDPARYEILDWLEYSGSEGEWLVVKIRYFDCTNYEGVKILVYRGMTLDRLKGQRLIDPHFSDNEKFASPFARFEPTQDGWRAASRLANSGAGN